MQRHNPSPAGQNIIFFSIVVLIAIADQLSKFWIRAYFVLGQSLPETGFLRLTYVQNTGAAFGIFHGNNSILTIVVIIEAIFILFYFFFIRRRHLFLDTRLNTISLGLIMGGVVGNIIDRIHLGYVTDFISIGPWPVFNLADSSGVVGVILFALSVFLASRNYR